MKNVQTDTDKRELKPNAPGMVFSLNQEIAPGVTLREWLPKAEEAELKQVQELLNETLFTH